MCSIVTVTMCGLLDCILNMSVFCMMVDGLSHSAAWCILTKDPI